MGAVKRAMEAEWENDPIPENETVKYAPCGDPLEPWGPHDHKMCNACFAEVYGPFEENHDS